MNKASKHIQSGAVGILSSPTTATGPAQPTNVINSIMSFLPDNRPITSLQIVEDYERCPKNFTSIHRTYDQDADADLWRESILFGRPTTRYLCLSKTEGLPEYVVETLKVIAEKIQPPKEFSLLSRTADSEQKAWRKRQIAYKLSKRNTVPQAVTDIILCSKLKIAPDGFKLAGDINGVLVCYKTGAIPVRLPPPVPSLQSPQFNNSNAHTPPGSSNNSEVELALNRLNLNSSAKKPLPPVPPSSSSSALIDHDYEEISVSYHKNSPIRAAPRPPTHVPAATNTSGHSVGTLGAYSELDGVPFIINAMLVPLHKQSELAALPQFSQLPNELDYDFQLERQILCTIKSSSSKNPFFQ